MANGKIDISPAECIKLLVKTALEEGVTDHGQIANILGQCEHETGAWIWNQEIAANLGKTCLSYVKGGCQYYGRGFIQITHNYNYKDMGNLLGQNFLNNPSLVLESNTSAKIAVVGMRDGLFTKNGKTLKDYCNNGQNDFFNARRLVNGLDQASKIERLSRKWLPYIGNLINGAEPDPNALPTRNGNNGGAASVGTNNTNFLNKFDSGGSNDGITSVSMGSCSEIFPIEFSLKEALHYAGCFSRQIGNAMGGNSNLGYSANGMQVNGASNYNIADFNPTVPICDGCLGYPFDHAVVITSPFCKRRVKGGRVYYHSGTDFDEVEGAEVIAVADGTVVTPLVTGGYNPGLVDIVHEQLGNLLSRSAHIIPSVQPGTKVKKGDVIGKLGPYGNNAAHLHLELRKDKGAGGSAYSEQECKTKFLDPGLFCKRI